MKYETPNLTLKLFANEKEIATVSSNGDFTLPTSRNELIVSSGFISSVEKMINGLAGIKSDYPEELLSSFGANNNGN